MLKAKLNSSSNRRKEEAMREVSKLNNDTAIYAKVTAKEMKKLKMHLLDEGISMVEWVKQKIWEI